ncbi:MAG: Co2+/Mg2+ efflux protein ApaG [Rhodospirillales bacterium]|nr:Co2+/Mg2+ efflux protein ApaG [Rhodospirillales bacterium]
MPDLQTYSEITNDISVSVSPEYLDQQSEPSDDHFTWAYHVHIENTGSKTIQVLTRHWKITDIKGVSHEIVGDGLIGQQPILKPGEFFKYSSGTPLSTSSGFMSGTLLLIANDGELFRAVVPSFSLDSTQQIRALH